MGMRINNDHPFTSEEIAYLSVCNREREIEENAQMFPVDVVEDPGDSYANWKNAELKQEIDDRNKLRGENDQIVPVGTKKEEMVAALEADDESHPEA